MKVQKSKCLPEDSKDFPPSRESSRIFFERAVASGLGAWPEGTVFLAAVSGGADSTALLVAMTALRQAKGYELHCLHVEHGIRPEEERQGDALAVQGLCKTLDVPYRLIAIPPGTILQVAKQEGLGVEGTARIFRHQALIREARRLRATRILVAHTQDDLLETVLMRFLRGSGPRGLAPMSRDGGRIVRPLLALTRIEVLDYLADRGIGFRTDTTNGDIQYLRNRIRHKLIPCLDVFFPGWKKAVLDGTKIQGLTADFLSAEAQRRIGWDASLGHGGRLYTEEKVFFVQPEIIREEALFQGADRLVRDSTKTKKADPWFTPDFSRTPGERRTPRVPRRVSLRLFTEGALTALDAGPLRIEKQGPRIALISRTRTEYNGPAGFALVVQEPGVYWFKGVKIVCRVSSPEEVGQEKQLFFAYLPLVFRGPAQHDYNSMGLDRLRRSGYTGKSISAGIIVEDSKGPRGFMGAETKELTIGLCRPEQVLKEHIEEAHIQYEKLCREEQGKSMGIHLFLS
ncbi:MAG: tRNA lysidine(34) synthetase TilS [Treponema sp.]|nr:tRNA lysidine(34) synthetase TilS [Treponema sp.]